MGLATGVSSCPLHKDFLQTCFWFNSSPNSAPPHWPPHILPRRLLPRFPNFFAPCPPPPLPPLPPPLHHHHPSIVPTHHSRWVAKPFAKDIKKDTKGGHDKHNSTTKSWNNKKKTPSPVAMRKGFNGGVKRHSTKQDCCLTITTKTNKKARFVVVKQQAMVKLRIQTKTPLQTELAKWCLCNAPETICLLKNPKQKSKTNKKKEDRLPGYRCISAHGTRATGSTWFFLIKN